MDYLEAAGSELTDPITRLLRDTETDNTSLILSIIEGGGTNRRLKGYLFGIAVFHADKAVAEKAMELLQKHCSADTQKQATKLRESSRYHHNEAEYLVKYHNPEFDLLDFLLAYKMVGWHRVGRGRSDYFVTAHQTLNLAHFTEDVLSSALENLDFVRFITLPASKSFDLAASFGPMSKLPLECIYIEGVRMDEFPVLLFQHPKIKTLSIKRGAYRPRHAMTLPEGVSYGCTTLEKLIIDGYPLAGEDRFGDFPNLTEAFLQRCNLEDIGFLKTAKKLEHLNIKFNQLEYLPAFLSELTELRSIALNGNPFKKIEINIEPLIKLEDFELKIQNKPYGHFRWY